MPGSTPGKALSSSLVSLLGELRQGVSANLQVRLHGVPGFNAEHVPLLDLG
jgi:hypothetical protein